MLELVIGSTFCLMLGWLLRGWLDAADLEDKRKRLIISSNAWEDLIRLYRKQFRELTEDLKNMRELKKSITENKEQSVNELMDTIKELEERNKELEKQIEDMQNSLN